MDLQRLARELRDTTRAAPSVRPSRPTHDAMSQDTATDRLSRALKSIRTRDEATNAGVLVEMRQFFRRFRRD